jgi:3-dehydroquinate dehydratase/shikimate dehydrogenase
MKRFGLIGNPVAGSLSPLLFAAAYGGRYPYDLLEGAEFGASWQRFLDGYDGINITAPFKLDAFRSVDVLTDGARLCGAVNLAVKTPEGIAGYNTDVNGVEMAVEETGLNVSEALVVGCGGAGRAAAVAAMRMGCKVTLANRTAERATALASDLGCDWVPVEMLGDLSPDLVVYTVPGPMDGLPDFSGAVVLEANYRTPCLEGRGRAYVSGRRWLLYQAVTGYSIFTGETPDTAAMLRIFC